jgi:hypothetical protein
MEEVLPFVALYGFIFGAIWLGTAGYESRYTSWFTLGWKLVVSIVIFLVFILVDLLGNQ